MRVRSNVYSIQIKCSNEYCPPPFFERSWKQNRTEMLRGVISLSYQSCQSLQIKDLRYFITLLLLFYHQCFTPQKTACQINCIFIRQSRFTQRPMMSYPNNVMWRHIRTIFFRYGNNRSIMFSSFFLNILFFSLWKCKFKV